MSVDRRAAGLAALALAGGLLMALAFPLGPPLPLPDTVGWWPAGWVCLAPIMLAAARARHPRGAGLLGLAAGLAAFGPILCWMHPFLVRWAALSRPEAAAVTALLVIYVALYPAIFAATLSLWRRRWGGAAFLLAPPLWTALELARGRLLTGFPWCLLGYSQQPAILALQVADAAGVYGVSFLLACAGGAIAWTIDRAAGDARGGAGGGRATGGLIVPAILIAAVAGGLLYGAVRLRSFPAAAGPAGSAAARGSGGAVRAALIQANVAQAEKWDPAERDRIEADHVAMTRAAARAGARLVVWSESSVPISITHHPDYGARLAALAAETGADLVVGTVTYAPRGDEMAPLNSAVLFRPDTGLSGQYDKNHLVPFGEYVPLKRYLFFLAPLVQEASDFSPGDGVRLLGARPGGLGALICYEAIFPELARRAVRDGAALLVNLTNDAWYGDTAMPRQHLMQAALRAVEGRRWLLRCANTGISAVVDPAGRIVARAGFERQEILETAVEPRRGATPYAAAGDAFAIGCAILSLVALAAAPFAKRRPQSPWRP